MNGPLRFHALAFAVVGVVLIAMVMGGPLIQPRLQGTAVLLVLGTPSAPVTLNEYARQRMTSKGPIADTNLADQSQSGRVVTYTVTPPPATENDACELRWTELAYPLDRAAKEDTWRYDTVLGWPDGLLVQTGADEEQISGEIWVPRPNPLVDVGRFVIRLRLLCSGGIVSEAYTAPFRVDVKQAGMRAPSP